MGRNVNRSIAGAPKPEREKVDTTACPLEYREYEESASYRPGLVRDKTFAPYQPHDIVRVNLGNATELDIRLARVLRVFAEYQERRGYYIPKWRMQIATRDGYWSGNWRYVWPGQIFRAYFDADEKPRAAA